MTANIKKIALLGMLVALTGAQCWGAADSHHPLIDRLTGAVQSNDAEEVQKLLRQGARINGHDWLGWTPLILAANQNNIPMVQLLLKTGANINATDKIQRRTALTMAAELGYAEMVQLLLSARADINAPNEFGQTALMLATQRGHDRLVQMLLGARANVNAANQYGQTALMSAAQHGHDRVVQMLLDAGANVNAIDPKGNTALILATQNGHNQIVQMLLSADARPEIDLRKQLEKQGASAEAIEKKLKHLTKLSGQARELRIKTIAAEEQLAQQPVSSQAESDLIKQLEEQGADAQAIQRKRQHLMGLSGKPREERARQMTKSEQLAQKTTEKQFIQSTQRQPTSNDLIVIIDPQGQETKEKAAQAMILRFFMALQEKAAPIIITKKIGEVFSFVIETVGTKNLKEMREIIKKTKSADEVLEKADEIFEKIMPNLSIEEKNKIITPDRMPIISVIDLDNKNWHGYIHKTENLVLLIPQAYIDKNKQGDIKKCGFALDSLIKIPDLSPKKFAQFLEKRETKLGVTDEFIHAVESMFIQDRLTPWNIYLTGHGGASEKINKEKLLKDVELWQGYVTEQQKKVEKLQKQSPAEFEKQLKKNKAELIQNVKDWQGYVKNREEQLEKLQKQSSEAPEEFEKEIEEVKKDLEENKNYLKNAQKNAQQELAEMPKNLKENLKKDHDKLEEYQQFLVHSQNELQKAESLHEGQIIPGAMAGLDFIHFARLMKFFDKNIKTSFLHYATCFGGGTNQTFLNDELKKLNVSFIVSSEGIAETSTYAVQTNPYISDETGDWIFSSQQFNTFFRLLNEFFGNFIPSDVSKKEKEAVAQAKQETSAWKKDPLKAIIQSIVPEYESAANTPFIRFPSIGVFSTVGIDKKVKILTNSIVKAYELEGEPIDLSGTIIENIIVYPHRIGVTLNMGGVSQETEFQKAIVLPTPAEFSQSYKATSIFEKIIFEETLSSFLFHLVIHNASQFKKIFLVKEVECWDYETSGLGVGQGEKIIIKNMVVLLSPEESVPTEELATPVAGNLDVCFEFNGMTYCGTIHIPNFENDEALFGLFDSFKAFPAQPKIIKHVAQEILDLNPKDLESWPIETDALLTELTQKIDNSLPEEIGKFSIGKTEPGALKKVLLKQQKAAEKAAREHHIKKTSQKGKQAAHALDEPTTEQQTTAWAPGKPSQSTVFEKSNAPITPQQVLEKAEVNLNQLQDMLRKAVIVSK